MESRGMESRGKKAKINKVKLKKKNKPIEYIHKKYIKIIKKK